MSRHAYRRGVRISAGGFPLGLWKRSDKDVDVYMHKPLGGKFRWISLFPYTKRSFSRIESQF